MKRLPMALLCMLLPAFTPSAPDRSTVERGPVQLSLVDHDSGQRLRTYRHGGQRWVAGEQGSSYAVRLRNGSPEHVLVVLSVDGINTLSGEQAAPDQAGYVLTPWQTTDITGWRRSPAEVARFTFGNRGASDAQDTRRGNDPGVVGIAVFTAKDAVRWEHRPATPQPATSARASPSPTQQLGTGHGRPEAAATCETAFERASAQPVQVSQLRYDTADNLRARGIPVHPPQMIDPQAHELPQRDMHEPAVR